MKQNFNYETIWNMKQIFSMKKFGKWNKFLVRNNVEYGTRALGF